MQVILKEDVINLGYKDDIVTVKDMLRCRQDKRRTGQLLDIFISDKIGRAHV